MAIVTACMLASGAAAEDDAGPTVLTDPEHSVVITHFEVAREANPSDAPLEDRLSALTFTETNGQVPNFGYTRDRLYARLHLENHSAKGEWVLRLGNPHLRRVHVLQRTAEGYRELFTGGYQAPAADRFILHRDFCYPVTFGPSNALDLLVVTETGQWLGLVPSVATYEVTLENRNLELAVGLFGLGGVIFVLLYNLFVWAVTRDRSYLLYVLASVTTHLLAVPGTTGALNYVFPHDPLLQESVWHASAIGWMGVTSYFVREFLVRDSRHVLERTALTWSGRLGLALAVVPLVFGPHDPVAFSFNVLTGLCQLLVFVISIRAAFWWRDRVARIFIAAWGVPLVAGAVFIVGSNGFYPVTDGILYVLSASSVWEVVVMALALGFRINLLQKDKAAAAAKLREANTELTRQISERSVQLFSALRLVDEPLRWNQTLQAGTEVSGRYRVERSVGEGAMGAVYVVRRLADDTTWAMKIAVETRRETLARFAREAHIASLVRHENVVHITDLDVSASGFMYIVLELVEGENLRDWLTKHGPASPEEAAAMLVQLARGLEALHAKGIAHRDLKPANVLLGTKPDGSRQVKITDFGVSWLGFDAPSPAVGGVEKAPRVPDASDPNEVTRVVETPAGGEAAEFAAATEASQRTRASDLTKSATANLDVTRRGMMTGTPRYIAPELVHLRSKDYLRGDIYSFGVLAYQVLTGGLPFDVLPFEVTREELLQRVRPKPMPESHSVFGAVIGRCLSFEHLQRPTAAELAAELQSILTSLTKTGEYTVRLDEPTPQSA